MRVSAIILAVCLAIAIGGIAFLALSNLTLSNQNEQLAADLTDTRLKLKSTEQKLSDAYLELKSTEQKLSDAYLELKSTEQQLAATHNQLTRCEAQVNYYMAEVERAKFTFYYASLTKQRYGVDDLEEYLGRWQWVEGAYVAGQFDCSQMSAYLEWKLENEGYHTVIVAGEPPGGDGKHSWLLVETSDDHYMPVEATTYSIVYWWNPHFEEYFVYDYEFEMIHQALEYSPTEFNWWE